MDAYTYPGVYIQELPSAVHSITGVATSVAAFVGWAAQGPTDSAVLCNSFMDFQRQFGGLDSRSLLGYALSHFYNNGGQQAYVVRVAQSVVASTGTGTGTTGKAVINVAGGSVSFAAIGPGAWSRAYAVNISASSGTTFTASVVYAPAGKALVTLETFANLSATAIGPITSKYVALSATGTLTAAPQIGLYPITGGADGNGVGVAAAASAAATIYSPGSTTTGFTFTARNPGTWANLLAVGTTAQVGDATNSRFSLNVAALNPNGNISVIETFYNLSINPTDPSYVVAVLNSDSNYLTAQAVGTGGGALNTPFPVIGAVAPYTTGPFLSGGRDGVVLDPTPSGSTAGLFTTALNAAGSGTGGVHLLDRVDAFNLLCVPGMTDAPTIASLQEYCYNKRAFYIVDCPQAATASGLTTSGPAGSTAGSLTGQYSINSAYYYPWVSAPDPLIGNRLRAFPPCGFIAGIYATTDSTRGVWKAPAGIDASLTGVSGLQYTLTDLENGNLNTQAINCLREFKVYGDVVWGSRTLQGNDQAGSQWKYVPIRRLALFIESSLYDGTQSVVFEPNDETLWGQIRLNVGSFMQSLFLEGAFPGTTPQQAYFVKCDAENNPPASVALGVVNVLVGFAPLYPAEFVVIQIQQIAGQN